MYLLYGLLVRENQALGFTGYGAPSFAEASEGKAGHRAQSTESRGQSINRRALTPCFKSWSGLLYFLAGGADCKVVLDIINPWNFEQCKMLGALLHNKIFCKGIFHFFPYHECRF